MKTIISKIIDGELPADKVFEDEKILVIKDIHPKAPVHLLIIPKKEIPNLQSVAAEDLSLMGELISVIQQMAKKFNIADGYRVVINNGATAGQSISHLHFHLLGGDHLGMMG